MNNIKKKPIETLGFDFIPQPYLPAGKDEYYFRFQQNPANDYRPLTATEIKILKANRNRSENWSNVLVRDGIRISLIEDCMFYGLVRIGRLEPYHLEFSEFRTPVGLYKSTIISCDIGNNTSISNVRFLSHYIIEDDAIICNVNEMSTTSHSKFGNGVIKEGEKESVRIWLELCNENGGRKVLPFDGMLAGDAWFWSKYRDDAKLMTAFQNFTEKICDNKNGHYGKVGKRTVIKNCHIIKDVNIGSDAYIKGANKLKNLTINSNENAKSQIGEGCEMVNGIMGYGSKAFYGVKAVRFILAPFSQLKYGARLINSYLGENATISCCEVLNSLIFPAHEQHHNNSFLCAALLMGQTNMAAGATIGSNHNTRGADGEIQAGRGFWPGLCVSLKHNSKFASFIMVAKGDYPAELNIPLPFSMISNEVHSNSLVVMPAYWFMYNMYAVIRNEGKFANRDHRTKKIQYLEYDFLAPDTVNEIFEALRLLELFTGKAFYQKNKKIGSDAEYIQKGKSLFAHQSDVIDGLNIMATGFENSDRPVKLIKVSRAYDAYKKMLIYYGATQTVKFIKQENIQSVEELKSKIPKQFCRGEWLNIGGQLIPRDDVSTLFDNIHNGNIDSWEKVHAFYESQSKEYLYKKFIHSLASLLEIMELRYEDIDRELVRDFFTKALEAQQWVTDNILESKAKDYRNPFRKMVYDTQEEMNNVVGEFDDNAFIKEQRHALSVFKQDVEDIKRMFK
ncbi:MAG: DUF4954 family protein [Niabella sp.]